MILTTSDIARFWAKVDIRSENECWPWLAARDAVKQYGKFNVKGNNELAHRVSLTIKLGRELLEDALHTCDNNPCCNPKHLFEGSNEINMRDKEMKLRGNALAKGHKGQTHHKALFSNEEIRNIRLRSENELVSKIAKDLWQDYTTIKRIVTRETYSDVL